MQDHKPHHAHLISRINLAVALTLLPLASMAGNYDHAGTFTVVDPGTQVVSAYVYQRKMEGYYLGDLRLGDSKLKADAQVLAYTNYGQTAGMPSSWNISVADIHVRKTSGNVPYGFGEETDELGDVRVGYTFWPVNNTQAGRTLAIASTLQIPTANYDHSQSLNSGENRWVANFQFGGVQQLTSKLILEVVPEFSLYGTNRNFMGYVMRQKPSYATTVFLRWRFLPTFEANIGYQANGGGKQTIGGYGIDFEGRQKRVFLGVSTALTQNLYTGLRYSHDTSMRYELKTTSDLVLSMHYVFK